MIDYNKPWGWAQPQQQQKNNGLAPLGGGNVEGAPTPIMGAPSMQDQAIKQVGGVLANKAVDGAVKGTSDYNAASTAADALSTSDIGVGAAAAGDAAGNSISALGPLGAAMGGAMKGEYDQAAGAALGSVLGAYFGPIGSMVGAKVGGYAGNAVGSVFGLADGTTKVPEKKESVVESIWNKLVNKGGEAVKVSTGNSGAVGQAKQALMSRKEKLDAAEKEAMGYAWGTSNAGGKGMGGGQAGPAYGYAGRSFGSTAPTGYYGDTGTGATRWKPSGFSAVNQPAPIAATPRNPFQPQPTVWGGVWEGAGGEGGGGTGGIGGGNANGDGVGNDGNDGNGGIGGPGAGTATGDAAGNSEGSGGPADGSGSAGGGGGGGGK
jgi:hypothetical protein